MGFWGIINILFLRLGADWDKSVQFVNKKKSSSCILRICALLHIYFHLKLLERNMEIYRKI